MGQDKKKFKTRDDTHGVLAMDACRLPPVTSLLAEHHALFCPLLPDGEQGRWLGKCRSVSRA